MNWQFQITSTRIYIKKVRKFLEYDLNERDESAVAKKKNVKMKMDLFFKDLKSQLIEIENDLDCLQLAVEDR